MSITLIGNDKKQTKPESKLHSHQKLVHRQLFVIAMIIAAVIGAVMGLKDW